jgi:hypothetical protein
MTLLLNRLALCAGILLCPVPIACTPFPNVPAAVPVQLILDTDFRSDCDDVGALAVAHHLSDRGEVDLIGVITSTTGPAVVAAIDAVNHFYGRPHIPIGLSVVADTTSHDRFAPALADTSSYPSRQTNDTAPTSTALYRRLLHEADRPVSIAVVGFMGPLSEFLDSQANHGGDGIPYTGKQLAAAKVDKLVVMAGNFIDENDDTWNVRHHRGKAEHVVAHWPGPVVFSGREVGLKIQTGSALADPERNPVAMAYRLWFSGERRDRASWDQATVVYAVRGAWSDDLRLWELSEPGKVTFSASIPHTMFTARRDGLHRYKIEYMDPADVARIIETMMIAPPARGR